MDCIGIGIYIGIYIDIGIACAIIGYEYIG